MKKMSMSILLIKMSLKHDRHGNHIVSDEMEKLASGYWATDDGFLYVGEGSDYCHVNHVINQILDKYEIDDWDFYNMDNKELLDEGLSDDEINVLQRRADGREYAIEHWGWSRISENNAEVKNINRETISGLLDCWYEEYGENMENMDFCIYHMKNKGNYTAYHNIPYEVLDKISSGSKSISALLPYRDI